jgi:OOP family OmpA-OmpF porin
MNTSNLHRMTIAAVIGCALAPRGASAEGAQISLSASTSDGASADAAAGGADAAATAENHGPPWGVEPGLWEVGLYWGLFFADDDHELFDVDSETVVRQPLENVSPELGLRAGWYPLRFLGAEIETGLLPTQAKLTGEGVNVWTVRGQAVLLAPTETIVPFLALGGGALGISSDETVLGNDVDGAGHIGLGAKAFVTGGLAVRLDLRDTFTSGRGDKSAQHFEALIGLSVVNGRPAPPPPPPPDSDNDGQPDASDKCPTAPGPAPDGCPVPVDSDGDGIPDIADKCPTEVGVASADATKNGCALPPPPPPDGDGDGVPDASDKCPAQAGDGPDGCVADTDGDGIPNRDDKCPDQPETKNGYEDSDGCPDELPQEVKAFTGVIEGIAFTANQATIQQSSFAKLDAAAKVLTDYPALRVEISGHTDSSGKPERNLELSAQRAEAVKTYFVGKGIAAERITTRGAGSAEPIGDNATPQGRAQNRRIEFKLVQ